MSRDTAPTGKPGRALTRGSRLNLAAQIYLAIIGLLAAFSVVAVVGWMDAGDQAHRRAESQIDDGLSGFQTDLDRATRDLTALGSRLVAQPDFAALLTARDGPGLTRYLQPWTELSLADTFTVADAQGLALSDLRPGQPLAPGTSLLESPGISQALSGTKSTGLAEDSSGRLQRRVVWPIYAQDGKSPAGALVLAFYLDGSFLQYRSRKPDQQIALAYSDKLRVITLTDAAGRPWGAQAIPRSVLGARFEGRPSEFVDLQTDVGPYLFRFRPLAAGPGEPSAMFGVGLSLASLEADRLQLFRDLAIGLALIALGTALGGLLFARALTRPLRALDTAAQSLARGDFSHEIRLDRPDELGDLARRMDWMRRQLAAFFQAAVIEKSRLDAVVEAMGAPAIITDQDLVVAAVNPAAQSLLRQPKAGLVSQPLDKLLGLAVGQESESPAKRLGEAEVGSGDVLRMHGRFPLRARPQLLLDVSSSEVRVDGRTAGYVHILADATAQEQLARAKDDFIMNAAHELRGPLASLRASIEVLVEDYATMGKQDLGFMLKTIQRGVVRFQGLVENLIDVGTIQAGRFTVRPIPTRLDKLFESARLQVEPLLQGRGQSLELSLDCPETCLVLADRPRISQVLINLLTNASKYGPEGQPISLSASAEGEIIVFRVTDRGPGIPAEEQAQLFRRFYRGRRAEEEGMGIGLGLALAREIVQAHGGRMDVSSQVGAGTTFWFSLPKAEQLESGSEIKLELVR